MESNNILFPEIRPCYCHSNAARNANKRRSLRASLLLAASHVSAHAGPIVESNALARLRARLRSARCSSDSTYYAISMIHWYYNSKRITMWGSHPCTHCFLPTSESRHTTDAHSRQGERLHLHSATTLGSNVVCIAHASCCNCRIDFRA